MADNQPATPNNKLGELFIDIGESGLGTLVKKLNTVSASFLLTKNAATQALKPLTQLSQNAGQNIVQLDKINSVTGISIKQLYEMQQFAKLNNISFEELSGQIQTLQKNLYAIRMNRGGNMLGFSLLGIDPRSLDYNKPLEALGKIMQRAMQVEPVIRANAIEELGLSRDLIYAYEQQNTKLDKKLLLNEKEINSLKEQQTSWNILKVTWDNALNKFIADQTWLNGLLQTCAQLISNIGLKLGDLSENPAIKKIGDFFQGINKLYGFFWGNVGEVAGSMFERGREILAGNTINKETIAAISKNREAQEKYITARQKQQQDYQQAALRYYGNKKPTLLQQILPVSWGNAPKGTDAFNKWLGTPSNNKPANIINNTTNTTNNISNPLLSATPLNDVSNNAVGAGYNNILPPVPAAATMSNNTNNVNVTINQNITAPDPQTAGRAAGQNTQEAINNLLLERNNSYGY